MVLIYSCDCSCNYIAISKIVGKYGKIQENATVVMQNCGCGLIYNSNTTCNIAIENYNLKP